MKEGSARTEGNGTLTQVFPVKLQKALRQNPWVKPVGSIKGGQDAGIDGIQRQNPALSKIQDTIQKSNHNKEKHKAESRPLYESISYYKDMSSTRQTKEGNGNESGTSGQDTLKCSKSPEDGWSQLNRRTFRRLMLQRSLERRCEAIQADLNVETINWILRNARTHIVAVFKEYLILDDTTEFLRRFYRDHESHARLSQLCRYYQEVKLVPQLLVLSEGKIVAKGYSRKARVLALRRKEHPPQDELDNSTFLNTRFLNSLAREDLQNSQSQLPADSLQNIVRQTPRALLQLLHDLSRGEEDTLLHPLNDKEQEEKKEQPELVTILNLYGSEKVALQSKENKNKNKQQEVVTAQELPTQGQVDRRPQLYPEMPRRSESDVPRSRPRKSASQSSGLRQKLVLRPRPIEEIGNGTRRHLSSIPQIVSNSSADLFHRQERGVPSLTARELEVTGRNPHKSARLHAALGKLVGHGDTELIRAFQLRPAHPQAHQRRPRGRPRPQGQNGTMTNARTTANTTATGQVDHNQVTAYISAKPQLKLVDLKHALQRQDAITTLQTNIILGVAQPLHPPRNLKTRLGTQCVRSERSLSLEATRKSTAMTQRKLVTYASVKRPEIRSQSNPKQHMRIRSTQAYTRNK